jgi:two-component system cell cycle response regulator DivK
MARKTKVLYIEDDPVNMILVRKLLRREGIQFLEAANGWAGIALAQTHMPDLILMDMNMPDMDGYEATRRIKSLPELRHIPVVALTANAMDRDRQRSLEAGCEGHITKPIDIDTFAQQVLAFLKAASDARKQLAEIGLRSAAV